MFILHKISLALVTLFFIVTTTYLASGIQTTHARLTDEDQAAQDAQDAKDAKAKADKEYNDALNAEAASMGTLTPSEPSAAAKASIERRERDATRRDKDTLSTDNSNPHTESTRRTVQDRDSGDTHRHSNSSVGRNITNTDSSTTATKGFFNKIFSKISSFFRGLTRGTSNKKDEPSVAQDSLFPTQNYSRTENVGTDSESKNMDLVPYTTSTQITQGNTIFSGKIMMEGKENNSDFKTKNRPLTNQLLVDYGCDQTIDFTKDFTTPNTPIRNGSSRIIPLSVRADNAPEGNHCFAFKIDTTNVVSETNESNNQSNWKTFTVGSNIIPTATSGKCPPYQQPRCGSDEVAISGEIGNDGCRTAPSCVAVSPGGAGPDDIMFEVKSYVLSDPAANGTTARITVKDWSSEDITLGKYQKLSFRWSAYNYDSCLASIYPEKYVFDGNTTSITGNTENSGIPIKGLSRVYSIECTTGDVTYKKEINVQAQY